MREKIAPADIAVAQIAAQQHGVVSIGQLLDRGLSKDGVLRRLHAGRLHRVHRGVYAVGHAGISQEGRWMAAVLACGEEAVLSHAGAAALWGLIDARNGPVDVSVPGRSGRARKSGIRLHRCSSLTGEHVMRRREIPTTTPARTVVDLRRVVPAWLWRRAVRQAEFLGLKLGPEIETDRTRSDPERDFLRFCRRHGLPAPEVNERVGSWTADFLWRDMRVAVETDSYAYHRGSVAFEDDRSRDLDLRRHGFDLRRFSHRQVREEPERVAADLRKALAGGEFLSDSESNSPPAPHRVRTR